MEREDRRTKRKLVNKLVEFFLIPSVMKRTFDGLITDISDSGLCLLTNSRLKYGQRIVIQDESYLSEKVASVRWTQKFDDIFYKIGLEFTEDQALMNMKDKRLYKRLTAKNLNVHVRMTLANYAKITDMSLDGLSIETDKKLNVGKEYLLRVEHNGSIWPIRGCIIWSEIKENNSNNKKNSLLIYRAGIRITRASNEIRAIIKSIEPRRKTAETQQYFSLSLDELDIRGKNRNSVESLHSISE